jgi:hypothetical protein
MLESYGAGLHWRRIGDTLTIELPDDTQKHFTVTGIMHDPTYPSPEITGFTTAAVTPAGMEYLGGLPLFTELRLRLDQRLSLRRKARSRSLTPSRSASRRSGRTVVGRTIIGKSIIESIVNTAVMILSFFGWIILLLSGVPGHQHHLGADRAAGQPDRYYETGRRRARADDHDVPDAGARLRRHRLFNGDSAGGADRAIS